MKAFIAVYFSMLLLIPSKVFRYVGFGTRSDSYVQFIYVSYCRRHEATFINAAK